MEKHSEDGPALTPPARRRKFSQGIWNIAPLVIVLALAGIAVSAVIIQIQLVSGTNEAHRKALIGTAADQYAGLINAQLGLLRVQMAAAATSPLAVEAMTSIDGVGLEQAGDDLTHLIPYADRVELIPLGTARLDRDASVPISYAALTVIQRAETAPFVGPEGAKLDTQTNRYYAARPVHDGAAVAGVLFVALSADFLLAPLRVLDSANGRATVQQAFEGTESVSLAQWGEAVPDAAEHRVSRQLSVPHWTVVLEPGEKLMQPVASVLDLLKAMAAATGLMLGGVLFAFSNLSRNLRRDAGILLEQTSNAIRGRRQQAQTYKLGVFQDMAREITRMGRPARERDAGAPARASSTRRTKSANRKAGGRTDPADEALADNDEVGDLLSDADEGGEDFLDVSDEPDENFGIEVTEDRSPLAMGLNLEPEIFRAYDIRGVTTTNLTEEVVYWIGRSFAAEARERKQARVAVGRDGRHSSMPLRDALVRGLTEGGVDVLDIGEVPTPVLYFATHILDTRSGIQITGSHNPPEYNGLKMVLDGVTLAEERIQDLRKRIEEDRLTDGDGDVERVDISEQYLERITEDVVVAQPLKVVVDCGNGVAGELAPALMQALGCEVVPLYCDIDGDFPNHHPDPADPANLEDLITVVKAEEADLGLAFDGDGDRLGVVTASGEIIWPDKLIMLYAQDIVGRNPGADIIYDVKCSRHLNSLISDLGGRPIMWKTGHSHIKAKLKETGAQLGGEFSGHICFGERWYGFDDALYSAARLLEILGSSDSNADEVFSQFPITYSTPELKVQTTEQAKFEIVQRLSIDGDFGAGTITTIDGLRVDYPDGWGLIRPSNTSPVLTLRFEADGPEGLDRIQQLFQTQLSAIDPKLRFR